jgi:hypothetical protein
LVQICFYGHKHITPKYEIYVVNQQLTYSIRVFNWTLSQEHSIIKLNSGSMNNVTLSNLISTISTHLICQGITSYKADNLVKHCAPQVFAEYSLLPLSQTEFIRPSKCIVLLHQINVKVAQIRNNNMKNYNKKI